MPETLRDQHLDRQQGGKKAEQRESSFGDGENWATVAIQSQHGEGGKEKEKRLRWIHLVLLTASGC